MKVVYNIMPVLYITCYITSLHSIFSKLLIAITLRNLRNFAKRKLFAKPC